MKKILLCILTLAMLVSSFVNVFASNNSFSVWTDNNRYIGNEETNTLASKLDRANLAYIICEAFDLEPKYEVVIKDVDSSHWAYKYISTVIVHGIMHLENGRFFPDEYVKRQEIPQYFKFLNISYPEVSDLPFADISSIEEENAELFKNFVAAGYLQPVSGNYLLPNRIITVTETISMMNRMFPNINTKISKYSKYDSHYLLKGRNNYLSNLTINGDLIITAGVLNNNKHLKNNNIKISNVEVKGNIYIMDGSLLGKFEFENVKTNNIIVLGKSPIILNIKNTTFNTLEVNSDLVNLVSDNIVEIKR